MPTTMPIANEGSKGEGSPADGACGLGVNGALRTIGGQAYRQGETMRRCGIGPARSEPVSRHSRSVRGGLLIGERASAWRGRPGDVKARRSSTHAPGVTRRDVHAATGDC